MKVSDFGITGGKGLSCLPVYLITTGNIRVKC